MKIKTQDYDDVTVVEMQGDLDADSVEFLHKTIKEKIETYKVGIVLDMSNVGFIDSEGLENLLWAKHFCTENSCQLRLAALDDNCSKILDITRLQNEFDRYDELAEAVKSFA